MFSLNNISQVSVLKGPQGTIYGRNAMAGVIDIHTKNPQSHPEADLSPGYGNFDTLTGSFYGSTPVLANVATNLAVTASNQADGWGANLYDERDAFRERDFGLWNKWVYTPDSATKITTISDYEHSRYNEGVAMQPVNRPGFAGGQFV